MLIGPDGALYATETAGRLIRLDLTHGTRSTLAEGLSAPEGLSATPWGNWIVAEVGSRRVVEIDRRNGSKRVVADNLPIGRRGYAGAPSPYLTTGVAVGSDGSIYVSSDLGNAIYAIRPR